jgi:hypothetical protein
VILCSGLMALTITTADGAERSFFTANNVLPGCKKIVAEGERVKVDENVYLSGLCVGMIYTIAVHDYAGGGYAGCVDVRTRSQSSRRREPSSVTSKLARSACTNRSYSLPSKRFATRGPAASAPR